VISFVIIASSICISSSSRFFKAACISGEIVSAVSPKEVSVLPERRRLPALPPVKSSRRLGNSEYVIQIR
jgi:hypothetical protein